jgi:hypothetical protein
MLVLVVDTNLFHEFRRLEDLPWDELGEPEEVVLVVTEPVQSELDEHKKSLGSSFKCNTRSPQGIGCCDGQTKQAPQQRGTWRDLRRA